MSSPATSSRPKYVESVKAAAAVLGYSESLIQHFRDQGNPAWRGCRCYIDELEAYIDEHGIPELHEDEADKWNLQILKERHRKLKIQNDIEEGKLMNADEVSGFFYELALRQKNMVKKMLEDELPALISGKPADEIRTINKRFVDRLCEAMQREMKDWSPIK